MSLLNRILIFSILFFQTIVSAHGQNRNREEYINKYKDIAVRQMQSYSIPASIILAQACLESADGNSQLAREANNHFGIKCHNWKGDTYTYSDDKENECFRKYTNPEESFRDHSDFLRYRERYQFLFELNTTDYKAWAHGLKKAGYATNPNYAQMLIKIIEDYSLYKYDISDKSLSEKTKKIADEQIKTIENTSGTYHFTLTRPIFKKNGVSYIIAGKNDNFTALAAEYNLFRSELLKFNDLRNDKKIEDGEVIYLESKKNEAEKGLSLHITETGEGMYDISQKYAIKLKKLYKYNQMRKDEEIRQGDEIRLRKR
jgi:LysM repeat protein